MKKPLLALCVVSLVACRDEQAGPKGTASGKAPPPSGALKALDAPAADLSFRSGATWAQGTVEYLGAAIDPPNPTAGQPVRLVQYFRALKEPPKGFHFFMHIVDGNTGQMLGNADHELQNGAAPLEVWPVGKVIEDTMQFQMPNYPGPIRFVLGFFAGDQRLPVDDANQHRGDNAVLGPVLETKQADVPEYRAPKAAKAPVIDGKLDDAAWAKAPVVTLGSSMDGSRVSKKTTARVTWDDKNIYVAFDAEDTDIWGSLKNRDDSIYNEDVVEAFFDANGDGKTYNELQVSPHNVNFDAAFMARRSDLPEAMKWDSAMKSAVQVKGTLDNDADQDERWTV